MARLKAVLQEAAARGRIRNRNFEAIEKCVHFLFKLFAHLLVGAPPESPSHELVLALRSRLAEHIQPRRVPLLQIVDELFTAVLGVALQRSEEHTSELQS